MANGTAKNPESKVTSLTQRQTAVDNILADPEVATILRGHSDKSEDIRNAAEYLVQRTKAVQQYGPIVHGLREAAHAIANEKIKIFISHKTTDEEAAKTIETRLSALGGKHIEVNYAPNLTFGLPWPDQLREQVRVAHWFILLLPDPSFDWDWVLFETGMFRAQMVPGNRLICLHHETADPPNQIAEFHAVKAQQEKIVELLKDLFTRPNAVPGMKPINPKADKLLTETAKEIRELVSPPHDRRRHRFEPFVRIKSNLPTDPQELKDLALEGIEKLLNEATLDWISDQDPGTNRRALDIFGKLPPQPQTWGQLVSKVAKKEGADPRWLEELCAAIKEAAKRDRFAPIQATFRAADEHKKVYRPILYAVERFPDGLIAAFLVVFVEDVGGTVTEPTHVPKKGYVELISSIRLGYRFRWEVVEEYRQIRDSKEIPGLKAALERVMKEDESRGEHDLGELHRFFRRGQAARVERLRGMFVDCVQNLGVLIAREDTEGLRKLLTNFASANQEYLKLSTGRFAEMNEELSGQHSRGRRGTRWLLRLMTGRR